MVVMMPVWASKLLQARSTAANPGRMIANFINWLGEWNDGLRSIYLDMLYSAWRRMGKLPSREFRTVTRINAIAHIFPDFERPRSRQYRRRSHDASLLGATAGGLSTARRRLSELRAPAAEVSGPLPLLPTPARTDRERLGPRYSRVALRHHLHRR